MSESSPDAAQTSPELLAVSPPAAPVRPFLVFIRCAMGKTYEVAAKIADLDEAPHVFSISGEYDLFCMFYLPNRDDVGRFMSDRLQKIDGITATNTIVCFNPFTPDKGFS